MDSNDDNLYNIDILNTGLLSEQDDVVRIHLIESVCQERLLYKILLNDRNIYKEYINKIGKKVSTYNCSNYEKL